MIAVDVMWRCVRQYLEDDRNGASIYRIGAKEIQYVIIRANGLLSARGMNDSDQKQRGKIKFLAGAFDGPSWLKLKIGPVLHSRGQG